MKTMETNYRWCQECHCPLKMLPDGSFGLDPEHTWLSVASTDKQIRFVTPHYKWCKIFDKL